MEEDGPSQRMAALALVEVTMRTPRLEIQPSVGHEDWALNAADLLQGLVKRTLALEGSDPLQHHRRWHRPGAERRRQLQHLVPVLRDKPTVGALVEGS